MVKLKLLLELSKDSISLAPEYRNPPLNQSMVRLCEIIFLSAIWQPHNQLWAIIGVQSHSSDDFIATP